uniref:tRNA N(3)-methylcytidine methyltransferase n=1 Tax=Panagrolaimus sp. PS1159 TaxID=55785 RepID=A0AC35FN59_9BILA
MDEQSNQESATAAASSFFCKRGYITEDGIEVSNEELERLSNQPCLNQAWNEKLEREAQKNWDKFYNRNNDKFFKDRHWAKEELEEVCSHINFTAPIKYLEAGCGVGNMLFPLSEWYPHWEFYGFDFSKNAVRLLEERAANINLKVKTAVVDLTVAEQIPFESNIIDFATLIFVISAIHPEKQLQAIKNLASLIKSGGTVVFRDYAAYDHAMMRFKPENKIQERFYKRADWTLAYYFHRSEVISLFEEAGFNVKSCLYYHTYTENRQMQMKVDRAFIQGVFVKK